MTSQGARRTEDVIAMAPAGRDRHSERVPTLFRSTLESMLDELCVRYGYCLPPEAQARLVSDAPQTVDEFTDDVMRAEGMDPSLESARRREVRACVERWFDRP